MAGTIPDAQWAALQKALSSDRLDAYRQETDPDYDRAVARYLFNSSLCEALYPTLHCLEVTLRNRLDAAICKRFGNRWLNNENLLNGQELRRIREAREKLELRGKVDPTHADIVSELNLGFWVALFTKPYERPGKLWPLLSTDVMSGAPRSVRTRAVFYERLDQVRNLRNRAFHYEPLWYWGDLDDHHARACEFLGWMSPEVASMAATVDRFAEIKGRGIDAYECLVEGGFICPIHNGACRHVGGPPCPSAPDSNETAPA
jgi:hypothetical protein